MALDRRRLRYGSSALVAVLAIAGASLLVNMISARHFHRWDWTGSKIYSLSDTTIKILSTLKNDVEATVLIQPDAELYDEVRELLNNYRAKSLRFKVEMLDPAKQPARVEQMLKKFGIDPRGDTTAVVFSSGSRNKHVPIAELADLEMPTEPGSPSRVRAFKGEAAFTSALLSVTEERQQTICFVQGHDEAPIESAEASGANGLAELKRELERANLVVKTIEVPGNGPIPPGCDLIVVAGPTRSFTPPEADSLGAYVDGGGRLLALLDPMFSRGGSVQPLGIESLLEVRGIKVGNDIVLDPSRGLLFATAESFSVADFPEHAITKDLRNMVAVLRLARSMTPVQPPPSGWTVSPLARTSDKGWGERDLANLDAGVTKGPEDLPGPVTVAAAAEKNIDEKKVTRLVAIGDSDLAQNQLLGTSANLDLVLNSIQWLIGKSEQIGIAPREPEQVHLSLTGGEKQAVMLMALLVMPGLAICGGIVVWLFRRR